MKILYLVRHLNICVKAAKKRLLRAVDVLLDLSGYRHYRSFLKLMNQTANEWGMKNTRFWNPSGASWHSRMSPRDLVSLGERAVENDVILHAWQQEAETIQIWGTNERTVRIVNTVLESGKPIMGDFLIGGKSGSWGTEFKAHLYYCKTKAGKIILSVFAEDEISFEHIHDIGAELCGFTEGKEIGPYVNYLTEHGGGYCIVQMDPAYTYATLNSDKTYIPASVTKVMTALVALRNSIGLEFDVVVRKIDFCSGSGSQYFVGDRIRLIDAISIMLLESSNTMANAIARTIGSKL